MTASCLSLFEPARPPCAGGHQQFSRHSALGISLLGLLLLAGCASQPPGEAPATGDTAPQTSTQTQESRRQPAVGRYSATVVSGDFAGSPELERFIDKMASEQGFKRAYLMGLFSQAKRKDWTLNYLQRQDQQAKGPPAPGSWSRYQAKFLDELHISRGSDFWSRHARDLERAQKRFGVPPEYILAILGVETIYGVNVGNHRVIDALSTLAFDYPRRSQYFTQELENYLLMTRAEGVDPGLPVGSYAGAMGFGQFMPSSFLKWAVDFDGDGRRDLWNPVDAIGSVGNYFAQHGWRPGQPVVVRAGGNGARNLALKTGYDTSYQLDQLADAGIRPSGAWTGGEPVRLLKLSANTGDEYWLGGDNFYVITRYNHSTHYAMAVHQLAQAIRRRHGDRVAGL